MFRRQVVARGYDPAYAPPADAVVREQPVAAREEQVVEERSSFDPAAIIALVSGFIFTMFGLLAFLRAGTDGFPRQLVTLGGITTTSLVALLTALVGVGLLLSGATGSAGRGGTVFLSAVAIVAGLVVIVDNANLPAALVAEEAFGWMAAAIGGITLVVSALLPVRSTSRWSTRQSVRP